MSKSDFISSQDFFTSHCHANGGGSHRCDNIIRIRRVPAESEVQRESIFMS
jgi:hypothetical protein